MHKIDTILIYDRYNKFLPKKYENIYHKEKAFKDIK